MTDDRKLRVLVIEDEGVLRKILGIALRSSLDVVLVAAAEDALALIDEGDRFDAIICDLGLPGMSGWSFYDHLHMRSPDQASRVLIMSGSVDPADDDARDFYDGPLEDRWLCKPVARGDIIRAVRRVSSAADATAASETSSVRPAGKSPHTAHAASDDLLHRTGSDFRRKP